MNHVDATRHVQAQTVLLDGMHVRGAADQRHAMAGAREHGAVETTDGSGADYGDRVEALSHKSSGG